MKEILTSATTWMNLEDIMQSKIQQPQKSTKWFYLHEVSSSQIHRNGKQNGKCQGLGGRAGKLSNEYRVSVFWDDMSSGDCTTMWMYSTLLNCTFKNG